MMSTPPLRSETPYHFRSKTIEASARQVAKNVKPAVKRRILSLDLTASCTREPNHDCSTINQKVTEQKAQCRIICAYIRAVISRVWQCQTWRGPTELQGHSSTCGKCQCAHWSLTPNLSDNKLTLVIDELKKKGVFGPESSPGKVVYLKNTLQLNEADLKTLDAHHTDPDYVDQFFEKHVSPKQWEHSFYGTSLEHQFNGICEGPTTSNNVDSRLEAKLRKKEDALCQEVLERKLTPKEAIQKLVQELILFYQNSLAGIKKRTEYLTRFIEVNKQINAFERTYSNSSAEDVPVDEFADYVEKLKEIIELRRALKGKITGAPPYSDVDKHRKDFYLLGRIVHAVGETKKGKLDPLKAIGFFITSAKKFKVYENDPHLTFIKYQMLEQEVTYQLQAIEPFTEEGALDELDTMLFGLFDEKTGEYQEATSPDYRKMLYQLAAKDPAAVDRQRKRKRVHTGPSSNKENESPNTSLEKNRTPKKPLRDLSEKIPVKARKQLAWNG